MITGNLAFTAIFLKAKHGYVGFIEELPNVNSHGSTLEEARQLLHKLVEVVFDEERRLARELTSGREVARELLFVPVANA
jgi:predicted RNase H-like HicB family nuclease